MYTQFRIDNFRGLHDLSVADLGRINLIVGPNNVGKTSLLEALWLFQGAGNPALTVTLPLYRGFRFVPQTPEMLWHSLFRDLALDAPIEIEVTQANGVTHRLEISLRNETTMKLASATDAATIDALRQFVGADAQLPETLHYNYTRQTSNGQEPLVATSTALLGAGQADARPNLEATLSPSSFLSARVEMTVDDLASMFTKAQDAGRTAMLVSSLQELEPRLEQLSLGFTLPERQTVLRGHVGLPRPIPLALLGGGAVRLTEVLLAVLSVGAGLVLIDEVESGLYYQNLERTWRAINEASKEGGVQIIATTHSRECVRAAVAAFGGADAGDFRLHRLERRDEGIAVVTYEHHTALAALDLNLEVR
jgi:energy-coupling factor transporter ATP-binding protein EcfA2